MKKLLVTFVCMLSVAFAKAQIVNIPDANFKAKLLAPAQNFPNWVATNDIGVPLTIDANNDGEIQLSELVNVTNLFVNDSSIASLEGIQSFYNLKLLNCSNNLLTSLNVAGLNNLQNLSCSNNQIANLNLTGCTDLGMLYCNNNLLTTLNFEDCIPQQLEVSGELSMGNGIDCSNNLLTSLYIKNGEKEYVTFSGNPNLAFICCDVNEYVGSVAGYEIDDLLTKIVEYGYTNCNVNPYCNFVPGGIYNTITGIVQLDENLNGCDALDFPKSNIRVDMTQWGVNSSTFTNTLGAYNFYTTFADQMVKINIENPSFFTIIPNETVITFPTTNFLTHTQNFCITPNGVHNDVEVVIAPIIPARPGFDAVYKLVFKNKGNQPLSGSVVFTFNDDLLDFVSSSPTTSNQQPATLTFDYTNLQPFENRSIVVTLNVNSPTETPAVNNGDVLVFQAVINPVLGDEIPTDNTFVFNQTVVGSYDPNDISCIEGAVVPPSEIGNFLHYLVRFENTGTAPAENIVVKTEIDPNEFDSATLQLLNASHPVYTRITNQKVEFIFENIMLESSGNGGGSGGHGHVLMKIKSKPTLQANDEVSNLAKIYFDYNFPVATNDYETVFQILSSGDFSIDTSIAAYPNPTKNNVTIQAKSNLKTIELFDVQGRLLETQLLNQLETTLNLTEKANGIYFVRITTEQGKKVEKIVKD